MMMMTSVVRSTRLGVVGHCGGWNLCILVYYKYDYNFNFFNGRPEIGVERDVTESNYHGVLGLVYITILSS